MEPKDNSNNPFGKWHIIGPEMQRIMQALIEASIIAAQREEELDQLLRNDMSNDSDLDDAITDIILDDVQEYPEALDWIMGAYRKGQTEGWNR